MYLSIGLVLVRASLAEACRSAGAPRPAATADERVQIVKQMQADETVEGVEVYAVRAGLFSRLRANGARKRAARDLDAMTRHEVRPCEAPVAPVGVWARLVGRVYQPVDLGTTRNPFPAGTPGVDFSLDALSLAPGQPLFAVWFGPDAAGLEATEEALLAAVARRLSQFPVVPAVQAVGVAGEGEAHPGELARARAETVQVVLAREGLRDTSITTSVDPIEANTAPARSRTVEIYVVGRQSAPLEPDP